MSFGELLVLAIGLSMDAFAVCMSNGLTYKGLNLYNKAKIVIIFGIFHFIMPTIGYFAGSFLMSFISSIDHRVALLLLLYVGGEMVLDSVKDYKIYKKMDRKYKLPQKEYSRRLLWLQAVAVSIDAVAVGLSLSTMEINIWISALCISCVCMIFCISGFFIGKKLGLILKHWSQLIGGLILIGIGLKVFLEHMLG